MAVKDKYVDKIVYDYTTSPRSRSFQKMVGGKPSAQVAHDTGNPGSTAQGNSNYFKSTTKVKSGAHTFTDDKEIRVIIPLDERAWHVLYSLDHDNKMWGDDSNDIALGHELCYGGNIDFAKAYDMWVWMHVWCAKKFDIPLSRIEGHFKIDPKRRTDPVNALSKNGETWSSFLADVKAYYDAWDSEPIAKASHVDELVHTIVKGDTLWSIAIEHETTVENLEKMNPGIKASSLTIGAKLTVGQIGHVKPTPKPVQKPVAKPAPKPVGKITIPSGVFNESRNSGTYSAGVKAMQNVLNAVNFKVGQADGYFGPKTTDAVKRFQSMFSGLTVDGSFGPVTRAKLISEYNKLK